MAEKHIADKESQFVAVNGPPDLCKVGKSIVPFDITDTLDKARDPSANVYARGSQVLMQTTRVNTVAGDAGSGVISGVSRGHTIVLKGSSTVYVNGKACARHDDPVGMNCNGGDTYNTTGALKTLQLGPKPKWGSAQASQELRERYKQLSKELHDNPMGKTAEEAAAVQDKVNQLLADTAEHEKAAMQAVMDSHGGIAGWSEATQLQQSTRNMLPEAERQVRYANPGNRAVGDAVMSFVPGSGLGEAYQDGSQAWGAARSGNWLGAVGHAAMAAVGVVTEVPGLKQIKGVLKLGKAADNVHDASNAAKGVGNAADSAKEADKAAGAGGGKGGGRDGVVIKGKATKVPCFHPFDKKKFSQMSAEDKKAYLKEMADQLQRQQDGINKLSAAEYKAARDAFESGKRNPAAALEQESFRNDVAKKIQSSIQKGLQKSGVGAQEAKAAAMLRTKEVMSELAALHESDMVAGGWYDSKPANIGRKDVNSSIGASWNQEGRLEAMDKAAGDAISDGKGHEKMNVKLEPCRGKGLK